MFLLDTGSLSKFRVVPGVISSFGSGPPEQARREEESIRNLTIPRDTNLENADF